MHHFTDLIWLCVILGALILAIRAGGRTRFGAQLAHVAQRRPYMVLAVIGIIYTAVVLQWSARYGRLAMDPQWDDVSYLVDAQRRLDLFDRQAFLKVIRSFWKSPPHSPWSTACPLFAFITLGAQAWTPYLLNVVLVLGWLFLVYNLLPALPVEKRLFLAALSLLLPIGTRLVQELRPDPALAVATVAFCAGLLRTSFFSPATAGRWQTHFRFGLLAGLALLIKPPFLYHTLVIMMLTQVFSALGISLNDGSSPVGRNRLVCGAAFFAAALLVSGAYYVRALPETIRYIHTNTANTEAAEVHLLHTRAIGGILRNFLVNGDMARMLGPFLVILPVVVILGLIFFVRQGRRLDTGYLASVLICAVASIAILTYGRVDNPYFGMFWEFALVLAAWHVIGQADRAGFPGPRVAFGFALLVAGTFLVHSPFAQYYSPSLDARVELSLNRALVLKIGRAWAETNPQRKRYGRVQVCFGGFVNGASQTWLAGQLRSPLEFGGNIEARSVGAILESMAAPDFVEVADPASTWLYLWLPSGPLQGALLARLRADPVFSELPPAAGQEGKVYVFQRNKLP
ncbi:MAG: hypothetical protein JO015_05820 [Verrucomicrobia bacterium]|nr:hypothetical protein [Verrucomicrobiota bacterium]